MCSASMNSLLSATLKPSFSRKGGMSERAKRMPSFWARLDAFSVSYSQVRKVSKEIACSSNVGLGEIVANFTLAGSIFHPVIRNNLSLERSSSEDVETLASSPIGEG